MKREQLTGTARQALDPGSAPWRLDLGANPLDSGGTSFRVWAPKVKTLSLRLFSGQGSEVVPLREEERGYFSVSLSGVGEGTNYRYLLPDGSERPDPASRFQPEGVHGPSQVVNPAGFVWRDQGWRGLALESYLIYELHVGTFTREGTFEALIPCLDYLGKLGVTVLNLMPVAQFPGERNWGYDLAFPFAPQNSYGGPLGLKRLIDACHRKGIAVMLDLVCNHLGPEGNYLGCFGHYFTDRYRTPWGDAINFDGPHSDEVRHYFISNALHWVTEYHVDALRLDAIHGIFDCSARPVLRQLAEAVHSEARAGARAVQVIAESSLNDPRTISPPGFGGHGLDAQWNDDFHHALHTLLTGERAGYYQDFGEFSQLVMAMREGFVYSGQYSRYRQRSHGASSALLPASRFVVFSQNHDQVGNRMRADRLSRALPFAKLKLAAGAVLLAPYLPLLFMGEEYAETAPFPYFVSHGGPGLAEAVRRGRAAEFAAFGWSGEFPDPQAPSSFRAAKLDWELRHQGEHRVLLTLYRELIRLRKELRPLQRLSRDDMEVTGLEPERILILKRCSGSEEALCFFNFSGARRSFPASVRHGNCRKLLDSEDAAWGGGGSSAAAALPAGTGATEVTLEPWSFVLYLTG